MGPGAGLARVLRGPLRFSGGWGVPRQGRRRGCRPRAQSQRGDALTLPAADVWEGLAGALACAAVGSIFAAMDAALRSLSPARLSALREQSTGISKAALDRYAERPSSQHSRWLVGRVIFMALASVLIAEAVAPYVPSWSVALLGALGAVATYGALAEIGINLALRRADDFTLRFL